MKLLRLKALRAGTRHEFLAELMKWWKTYTRKYPEIKQWTKKDVYEFYYSVKGGVV